MLYMYISIYLLLFIVLGFFFFLTGGWMWMAKGPDSACRSMLGLCSVSLHASNLRHAPTMGGADAILASCPADSISARGERPWGWEMLGAVFDWYLSTHGN